MKNNQKTGVNKVVHFTTFIGIILIVIPASMNAIYLPFILLLMGINLFNSSLANAKSKSIRILMALLSLMPLIIYFIVKWLV